MSRKVSAERARALKNDDTTPIPDFQGCGVGRGAECCVFFTVGAHGACCERWGPLHKLIVKRHPAMIAKRMPVEPWPACMVFREVGRGSGSIN